MGLEIKNIRIDKEQVLKFLGYGKKQPAPIILRKIDEEIERAKDLYESKVFLKEFQIDRNEDGEIIFGNIYSIKSSYVAEELKDINSIYLSLYTLGNQIQNRIDEHSKTNEMIRAMILDKIGVVALDNVQYQIKEEIAKKVAPLNISTELYPAQKDFHISNQKMVFDVFKEENDIISISKHYQFNPIKTVAVLFGIGKDLNQHSMCHRCENKCY